MTFSFMLIMYLLYIEYCKQFAIVFVSNIICLCIHNIGHKILDYLSFIRNRLVWKKFNNIIMCYISVQTGTDINSAITDPVASR